MAVCRQTIRYAAAIPITILCAQRLSVDTHHVFVSTQIVSGFAYFSYECTGPCDHFCLYEGPYIREIIRRSPENVMMRQSRSDQTLSVGASIILCLTFVAHQSYVFDRIGPQIVR